MIVFAAFLGLVPIQKSLAWNWNPTGDNYGRVKTISVDMNGSGDITFVLTDGSSDSDPCTVYYDEVLTPLMLSMLLTAKSTELPVYVHVNPYWVVSQINLGLQEN